MLFRVSRRLVARRNMAARGRVIEARIFLLFVLLCTAFAPCHGQQQHFLCGDGFGFFSSEFHSGVTVAVSAQKSEGFASHACDATLRWGKDVLPVIRGAWKVDVDVMGADLGLGTPVVAFQYQKSELNRAVTYKIYSLRKPPRLLGTIIGGDYYRAQDLDLDGHIAIWTNDAVAFDDFESLPLSSFDFLPTVALRYKKGRLIDVSSEYQPYYDHQINLIMAELKPEALSQFRSSDGKLTSISSETIQNLHTLLRTKIKVLEIVCSYLYSGRQQEAWNALAAMWPPADLDRIRSAIQDAQARGILRQVAEVVEKLPPETRRRHHAMIYNMAVEWRSDTNASMVTGQLPAGISAPDGMSEGGGQGQNAFSQEILPKPIYLGIPPPQNQALALPQSKIYLDLVIDAAGKVHSARLANKADSGPVTDSLIQASKDWKFIPGFRAGRAVACRIHFGVSPYQ
jgi:hypothetical protein